MEMLVEVLYIGSFNLAISPPFRKTDGVGRDDRIIINLLTTSH